MSGNPAATHVRLHPGAYQDSVRLMQIGQRIGELPGVVHALVAMATTLNVELARQLGFTTPPGAGGNDLLVAVAATNEESLQAALARLEAELAAPAAATAARPDGAEPPPHTVGAALRRPAPDGQPHRAPLALVSTPGEHAFVEAVDAIHGGASVMIFSDNVPLWQEVRLKELAAEAGVLVLGPDCGTAVVGGVGLGFANAVRPGPVGIVAASGTGAQQVMCLLDAAGTGVSHCLGVGGRDLGAAVGGRSTLAALGTLDADANTEIIVVVSKPPDPRVAARIQEYAATLTMPVVLALLGPGEPDLTEAVTRLLRRAGLGVPARWPVWLPDPPRRPLRDRPGYLRGLFSGGTLAGEAMLLASAELGEIRSNVPLRPGWGLPPGADPAGGASLAAGHWVVDFGADELTRGRPHPMIDDTLRLRRLATEAADTDCAVILLDLVLGHGAADDPAAQLAPAVADATAAGKDVVVALIGTADDPQGLARQAEAVRAAGAAVFRSNAEATRHAIGLLDPGPGAGGDDDDDDEPHATGPNATGPNATGPNGTGVAG